MLDVLTAAVEAVRGEGVTVDERARPVELPAADRLFRKLLQGAMCNGYPRRVFDRRRDEADAADPEDDSPRIRTARDITQRKRDWNSAPTGDQLVWVGLSGMSYLPATVVPVGRTRQGLPVGLQVVAAVLEDRTAIDVARRIATVVGGFQPTAERMSNSPTTSDQSGTRHGP